jgi:response regulator RpfG family c-di-GMP phosphodiesterase
VNRSGGWWAREINVVTLADDYDAMTSEGPERAYRSRNLTSAEAARVLRAGTRRGRYEPAIADIFIVDLLKIDVPPQA